MRLGGIYALEGVMNTSLAYRLPVLEALCAFVRDRAKERTSYGSPAADIQAALTVLGRRADGPGTVNLDQANISKADLAGASLRHASLWQSELAGADLSQANLGGASLDRADLRNAKLDGQAQLDDACGTAAKLPPDLTLKPCLPK